MDTNSHEWEAKVGRRLRRSRPVRVQIFTTEYTDYTEGEKQAQIFAARERRERKENGGQVCLTT